MARMRSKCARAAAALGRVVVVEEYFPADELPEDEQPATRTEATASVVTLHITRRADVATLRSRQHRTAALVIAGVCQREPQPPLTVPERRVSDHHRRPTTGPEGTLLGRV